MSDFEGRVNDETQELAASNSAGTKEFASLQPETVAIETQDGPDVFDHLLPFFLVGIGASAGGVEAYIDLFTNLPPDTGMSFVVVPHLAPDQKSQLVSILASKTAMPVAELESDLEPQPNHVYVLAPNTVLTMANGRLHVEPRPSGPRHWKPIDIFFRSLAADQKNHAVGVILSGTASDGAIGLKTIKGEGGIAIVQEPDSARFPGMPINSINADHVDMIVPPVQIGFELAQLARQFENPNVAGLKDGEPSHDSTYAFNRILRMLRDVSGLDFRLYKQNTVRRRVARRLMLRKFGTLSDYAKFLQGNSQELTDLHEDLLINVTQFFRNPEVFEALTHDILPRIFDGRPHDQQIRLWVAACSTGEEVYSIAMCLVEYLAERNLEPPIQIFGTDASERSIETARMGIYPESISSDLSPERLKRFFTHVDKGYQVSKRVRDLCIFARQNLINDPPFSKIDLISCRNILIYLSPALQNHVIPIFNYALRPSGYLLLGHSETIRDFGDLFTLADRRNKFYTKASSADLVSLDMPGHTRTARSDPSFLVGGGQLPVEDWSEGDLQRAVDRLLLARFSPPALVVNYKMEVLQFRGQTNMFLGTTSGPARFNLTGVLRQELAMPIQAAVQRAIDHNAPVQLAGIVLNAVPNEIMVDVEVLPIPSVQGRTRCYLILFTLGQSPRRPGADSNQVPSSSSIVEHQFLMTQLQNDLSSNKAYLQSLIDDRDAKNQELVSANEEIQSANEELQSTNEELETTKEELQSTNEELQTINDELQERNLALTRTSNDFTNLFTSVNIPVLILNNDLQIRYITPLTQRLLNVRPSDIGRPITDMRLNLSVENLEPVLREVLETLGTKELEVQDREGHWHLLRIRPYRTTENRIEGIVLVMVDVDQLRRSEQELREARNFARAVTEGVDAPILVLDKELRICSINSAFRKLAGLSPEQRLETRSFMDLSSLSWSLEPIRMQLEALSADPADTSGFSIEYEVPGPVYQVFQAQGRKVQSDRTELLLITIEDKTARTINDNLIAREKAELESRVQTSVQALERTQEELRALSEDLFTSQEEERRRVARELHDDVCQKLAALCMDLENLKQSTNGDLALQSNLTRIGGRTLQISDDVRNISHQLHPSLLEDLGLPYALKALGDEFSERERMLTTVHWHDVSENIPVEVSGSLYRIAQEALRNIAKHAGRTHVKISLTEDEEHLCLEVADFGEGFDIDEGHHGLGLISMTERARIAQAQFSIKSELGKGTTIKVDVPITWKVEDSESVVEKNPVARGPRGE